MAFPKALISYLLLVLLSNTFSEAAEFVITAKINWHSFDHLTKKPQKLQLYIGDSVVINYDNKTDSLLEVNKENYKACCTEDPIKSYSDGKTSITFEEKGCYYFISGVEDLCREGEKVQIKVLKGKHHPHPPPAPVPVPSPPVTPPPAPVPVPSPPVTPPSAPVPVPVPAPGPSQHETPVPAPAPGPSASEVPVPAPTPGSSPPETPIPAPAPAPCSCEAPVPTQKLPRKNGNSGQNAGFWHYFF